MHRELVQTSDIDGKICSREVWACQNELSSMMSPISQDKGRVNRVPFQRAQTNRGVRVWRPGIPNKMDEDGQIFGSARLIVRNPLEGEAIPKTAERELRLNGFPLVDENGRMFRNGESRVNEQILMKLAAYGDTASTKEAAYGDTVKALGTKAFKAAGDTAFRKLLQSKTKEDLRRAILQINAISAANKFVQENAKGITTGALTAGAGGALAGAGALMARQREREKKSCWPRKCWDWTKR